VARNNLSQELIPNKINPMLIDKKVNRDNKPAVKPIGWILRRDGQDI
jgi:hypothetical protein